MAYVKIIDGIVVQKQPYDEAGFVKAPDTVVCGMIADGKAGYRCPERSVALRREHLCQQLEVDLHHYIFHTHDYPVPTQITLQALYADPDSHPDIKVACKRIFDWIRGTVLPYYYERKFAIMAAPDPDVEQWDFSATCDAAATRMTLSQILQLS